MNKISKRISKITKLDNIILNKTFLSYETLHIYKVDEINPTKCKTLHKYKIKNTSHRYLLFNRDEKKCVCCGVRASFWALQYSKNSKIVQPHLNLYGIDNNNEVILFTKDHVYPKSLGGKDSLDNYQIMCAKCNTKKDSSVEWEKLGIETQEYEVFVSVINKSKEEVRTESIVVLADNENNAKGIACKTIRKMNNMKFKAIPIMVKLI